MYADKLTEAIKGALDETEPPPRDAARVQRGARDHARVDRQGRLRHRRVPLARGADVPGRAPRAARRSRAWTAASSRSSSSRSRRRCSPPPRSCGSSTPRSCATRSRTSAGASSTRSAESAGVTGSALVWLRHLLARRTGSAGISQPGSPALPSPAPGQGLRSRTFRDPRGARCPAIVPRRSSPTPRTSADSRVFRPVHASSLDHRPHPRHPRDRRRRCGQQPAVAASRGRRDRRRVRARLRSARALARADLGSRTSPVHSARGRGRARRRSSSRRSSSGSRPRPRRRTARELARALVPSADADEVARRQALTAEAVALLDDSAEPPLEGIARRPRARRRTRRAAACSPPTRCAGSPRRSRGGAARARRARRPSRRAPLLQSSPPRSTRRSRRSRRRSQRCVEDDGSDLRDTASPLLRGCAASCAAGRQRVDRGAAPARARVRRSASTCRRTSSPSAAAGRCSR